MAACAALGFILPFKVVVALCASGYLVSYVVVRAGK